MRVSEEIFQRFVSAGVQVRTKIEIEPIENLLGEVYISPPVALIRFGEFAGEFTRSAFQSGHAISLADFLHE